MFRRTLTTCALTLALAGPLGVQGRASEDPPVQPARMSLDQAREAVNMLHDLYVNAVALTNDTYRGMAPAAMVAGRVFEEMAQNGWLQTRCLTTTGRLLNSANSPRDPFERDAAAALKKGQTRFERIEAGQLRVVVRVPLNPGWHVGEGGEAIDALSYTVKLTAGAQPASAAPRHAAPARKVRLTPKGAPGATHSMSLEAARAVVAMLDDAYQLLLQETHATYHTRPDVPVAAKVIREVQTRMNHLGWPEARFLAVNAIVMHPDHVARDDFERRAVQTLRRSDQRIEEVVDRQFRAATVVPTGGSCFSCHWTTPGQASKAAITWKVPLGPAKRLGR